MKRDETPNRVAPENGSAIVSAALNYSERGWPVFPLRPRRKEPLTTHGFKDASTDAPQIRRWWRQWHDANVGIRTGDGLLALDVDRDKGERVLHDLEDRHGPLPETCEVRTARGYHLILGYSREQRIQSWAGKFGAGLDLRAEGG